MICRVNHSPMSGSMPFTPLGQMELPEDDETLARIIQRLDNDSLESPSLLIVKRPLRSRAALRLVERLRRRVRVHLVEPLLVNCL